MTCACCRLSLSRTSCSSRARTCPSRRRTISLHWHAPTGEAATQLRQHRDGLVPSPDRQLLLQGHRRPDGSRALQGHHAAHAGFDRPASGLCHAAGQQEPGRVRGAAAGEDSRVPVQGAHPGATAAPKRQRRKGPQGFQLLDLERLLRQEGHAGAGREKLHLAISEALHAPSARENLEAQGRGRRCPGCCRVRRPKSSTKRVLCSSVRWPRKLR